MNDPLYYEDVSTWQAIYTVAGNVEVRTPNEEVVTVLCGCSSPLIFLPSTCTPNLMFILWTDKYANQHTTLVNLETGCTWEEFAKT